MVTGYFGYLELFWQIQPDKITVTKNMNKFRYLVTHG